MTFVIDKVPINIPDNELKKVVIKKLIIDGKKKFEQQANGFGVAS